jgi:hypothetical protein
MSDSTLRQTWPDENPDDYVFVYCGKKAGLCYRSRFDITVGDSWVWTIYSSSHPHSGVTSRSLKKLRKLSRRTI